MPFKAPQRMHLNYRTMRYWFDTEFHDHQSHIDLISIGVVAEDGREYYAVNADYDTQLADGWLQQHVIAHMLFTATNARSSVALNTVAPNTVTPKPRAQIKAELHAFFTHTAQPIEFWADHGEYDWIALRQLFGTLTQWPQGWPWLCMDIEQWRLQLHAPPFAQQSALEHHALHDARCVKARFDWLHQFTSAQI